MSVSFTGPGGTLTLTDLDASEGDLVFFRARAEGAGLSASVSVETLHGDGLAVFAAGLDRDFRGWPGERAWRSYRGDLELCATHHGRAVELAWTVHGPEVGWDEPRPWSCTVRIRIVPGEELRRFSADLAEFLSH